MKMTLVYKLATLCPQTLNSLISHFETSSLNALQQATGGFFSVLGNNRSKCLDSEEE